MTRINVVPVQELCDQHLLAEHRELTRIPNCLLSGKYQSFYPDQPQVYKLGEGHVKFFTNKVMWLKERYRQLNEECLLRGFNVKDVWPPLVDSFPDVKYEVTEVDLALNRERIKERWPLAARHYGKSVAAKL